MSLIVNRKRLRSSECSFITQSKCFINNHLLEQRDPNKMKLIYDKTLNLLFKGVKEHNKNINANDKKRFSEIVKLCGNGVFSLKREKTDLIPEMSDRNCKCCLKQCRLHADCVNCNLELCEFCGLSCDNCDEPLCSSCVNLFDCGSVDKPSCSSCKSFID